ncbi:MAG: metallophosphoesterase family protein [Ruegeria sp.]
MLKRWYNKLTGKVAAEYPGEPFPEISPDTRFYAIGDIHGRLDLLQSLLATLDADCPLIFVGDYIDRGEYGAQVLRHLHYLDESQSCDVVCLLGNHEEMLLRFVDDPKRAGRLWLHNGGLQTLASFGLSGISDSTVGEDAIEVAARLREAMGERLLNWLQERPLTWSSGNVSVVHAALDPSSPLTEQHRQVCLWGHPKFQRVLRSDGQWVVHGHTIVEQPEVDRGVISIDTGAFFSNRLTAAEISKTGVRFLPDE